jgi:hypothetical protein
MTEIDKTACFSMNPEVQYTVIDDEAVLMGAHNEKLYGLNEVATEILKQLELRPLSIQEISDYLLDQFEVNKAQSIEDTQKFIESLLAQNLIIRN